MSSATTDSHSEEVAERRNVEGEVSTSPPVARGVATYWWITALVLFALFLGALAYAETVVLHRDLPQDRASRIALIAFRTRGALVSPDHDWDRRLAQNATDPRLLQEVIDRLNLRDSATGDPLTPARLRASMTVDSQCVEVSLGQAHPVRGLLLINVIRGSNADDVERIANQWTHLVLQRSVSTFSGLTIQPIESFGGTYEICR